MDTPKKEKDSISRRDQALYACYIKRIKEHGDYAKFIPKHILYQEVAELFFVSERTVYNAIKNMISCKEIPNSLTEEETKAILNVHSGFKQD
jgi:hypothetical protein